MAASTIKVLTVTDRIQVSVVQSEAGLGVVEVGIVEVVDLVVVVVVGFVSHVQSKQLMSRCNSSTQPFMLQGI